MAAAQEGSDGSGYCRGGWEMAAAGGSGKDDDNDDDDDSGVDGKGSSYGITVGAPKITALIPTNRTPQDSIVDGDEKRRINDHFERIRPPRSLRGDIS
ncbi:hypothetical protein BHE74_00019450 [Ensete ventricosum]|nr:hypothetical protein BHE74_00019450 [Ensete ventricosum]